MLKLSLHNFLLSFFVVAEKIAFTENFTILTVKEGKDAFIRCEVKGEPQPNVTWYYNGQPIIVECKLNYSFNCTIYIYILMYIFTKDCMYVSSHFIIADVHCRKNFLLIR